MTIFDLQHTDSRTGARRGRVRLAHGVVETPIFMPVGTQATVKSVHPQELRDLDAQIILGNTYHLNLRPGMDVMQHFGGLHRFMQWDRPILTDSGGFQVFSLGKLRKISEKGVTFQSHIDGAKCFLGPEEAMQIQATLGSDIAMLFDECPPYPCERGYAENSLGLTSRWAQRCREWIDAHQPQAGNGQRQCHFGIVQGSVWQDLRERNARELVAMEFDGYAVGGVSVGEEEEHMMQAVEWVTPLLPVDKPRYTMGVGTPPQLLKMIARGVDMFDCVLPTRVARNGAAFTTGGLINLRNKQFEKDDSPLDPAGTAPACQGFTRGYIRHLIKAGEILGIRLVTLHNLWFYLNLMRQARHAIEQDCFQDFHDEFCARYAVGKALKDAKR
jgi:queuine tRNA-ribosyltransferase